MKKRIELETAVGYDEYEIAFVDHTAVFRMNAGDPGIMQRFSIALDKIDKESANRCDDLTEEESEQQLSKVAKMAINEILGYDAADDIFGMTSPMNTCSDGRFFYMVILDCISDIIQDEIAERKTACEKMIGKYLKEYE